MTACPNVTNIVPYIYQGVSIPNIVELYCEALSAGSIEDILHASKLMEYHQVITDRVFLEEIRKNFDELYNLLSAKEPDLLFCVEGRRKSLISLEKKILTLMEKNKSLDTLRDLFAFRITLFDEYPGELIDACYKVAEEIIIFMVSKGFIPCEASPRYDIGDFNIAEHPGIVVPEKSGISPRYQYAVKDYICDPKNNGYQSLHIAFRDARGRCFEIQIRTHTMHVVAENGSADHEEYKQSNYTQEIDFNPNDVHIKGYKVNPNNNGVDDKIGLVSAVSIIQRQKTFQDHDCYCNHNNN